MWRSDLVSHTNFNVCVCAEIYFLTRMVNLNYSLCVSVCVCSTTFNAHYVVLMRLF